MTAFCINFVSILSAEIKVKLFLKYSDIAIIVNNFDSVQLNRK